MKEAKVQILEPSLSGYTGVLCGAEFKNGISVRELSFIEQQRLCAVMRAVTIDGNNVSPAGMLVAGSHKTASEARLEEKTAEPVTTLPRGQKAEVSETAAPAPVYTREELEAVADAEGIKGLRVIGDTVAVRGKTIPALIDAILKAQGGAK
ncbi:hypothetical protein MWH03_00170 [Klebsiella pneumoniae]|nr:hypothetical protein [Klebsiella pneumoniae]